ncbi:MAG: methyltransferase domain-containing protein [Anaerolineae bacterium]|nr:methyltransferase domain-containing protein [Anaerolineae bacterium]
MVEAPRPAESAAAPEPARAPLVRGPKVRGVYEQDAVRRVTGDAIRPGGLALTRRALTLATLPVGAQVLDVGCGAGATAALCRAEFALDAVGLDLSAVLLAESRARHPAPPLLQATALRIPFADGTFAAVLAECSLSLVTAWDLALGEVHRVLQPEGRFILSDLFTPEMAPDAHPTPPESRLHGCLGGARSRSTIEAHLTAHGFTLLHWEDHTPALRQFAARLVWEHGSLAAFWACAGAPEAAIAAFPARPGYFLAVAKEDNA